jgi:RNA recognition motif-containing protein
VLSCDPLRNGGAAGNEPPRREKTEKPEGCRKLFAGNLSYNIDDATIVDFFKDCGELTGLRWLTRQGTEEFRVSCWPASVVVDVVLSTVSGEC